MVIVPDLAGISDRFPQFSSRNLDQKPLPADMRYTMYGTACFGVYAYSRTLGDGDAQCCAPLHYLRSASGSSRPRPVCIAPSPAVTHSITRSVFRYGQVRPADDFHVPRRLRPASHESLRTAISYDRCDRFSDEIQVLK